MIALDLIKSSLRIIGAIQTGETPEAAESIDALETLNQVLDGLALSTHGSFNQAAQSFTLVPGQSAYTIGDGGNFNTNTPIVILDAYTTNNGSTYPIEIIDQRKYDSIVNKSQASDIPTYLLFQNTAPLGNIILWPVPSAAVTLTISSSGQFANLPLLTSSIIWPKGAVRMVKYLLAIELAEEYGAPVSQTIYMRAAEAKADYKRANARPKSGLTYDATLRNTRGQMSYADFIAGNF